MDDHMALDRAVFAEDVHRAPIRDPRHCQPRHTRQGGLVVERGGQHFARLCEEAQARLRALVLGDVMHRRHASDDVSVSVADRSGAEAERGPRVVAALDRQCPIGIDFAVADRAPQWPPLGLDRLSVRAKVRPPWGRGGKTGRCVALHSPLIRHVRRLRSLMTRILRVSTWENDAFAEGRHEERPAQRWCVLLTPAVNSMISQLSQETPTATWREGRPWSSAREVLPHTSDLRLAGPPPASRARTA